MGVIVLPLYLTIRKRTSLEYQGQVRFSCSVGTPEGIRTPDLLVRSQTLYPTELLARLPKDIIAHTTKQVNPLILIFIEFLGGGVFAACCAVICAKKSVAQGYMGGD